MPSSLHDQSSNSENGGTDEHQKQSESQIQSQSPATGIVHPGMAPLSVEYMMPPHLEVGHAMAQTAYPYPDPYYRSIFTPYGSQPMIHPHPLPHPHPQLMGIQAAVPLPSDAIEEPVYVNAKQYHGILRRRQSRAKAESENKMLKNRKPYMHESRHLHALRRARGCGGRFLNAKTDENQQTSNGKAQSNTDDSNKNQNSTSAKAS